MLNGHEVLYKGLRFWIFKINKKITFEGNKAYDDLIVIDCLHNVVGVLGKTKENGEIYGSIQFGMGSLKVKGLTILNFLIIH